MMIYLKYMAGYKMGYFKEIEALTAEASRSEPIQEQPTKKPKELSKEELKKMLEIVLVEEIKVNALQVKYPIIDWEIHTEGSRKYWKINRVRNIIKAYQVFEDMLKGFDREDLVTLWSLVKERFRSAEPTEDMERALWVELKRLFKPDKDDVLWKLQKYMHDPLTWRLYDTCGVHHVSSTRGHDIYMLTEKDYPLSTTVMGLMLSRRLQVEEDSEMARDLGGILTMTYTTSTTKTKAAQYDLPGIEDMVPNIWILVKVAYDKYALWGIFYAFGRGMQSRGDVYSTKCILEVTHVSVMRKHEYGYLEEIVVRRAVNNRLSNLSGDDVPDFEDL
ncbi:hypothetical protein Tco_0976363 [Tanacetum coccineum]|uniref:Uncharacterized protein n=1 Tax=Tanacetum coccineum TaxID=301880 RepID=A0ABQ5EH03_9ASTR